MTTRIIGIQARMGSTRLPGKVLMDLGGKTMLQRVVETAQEDCIRVWVLTSMNSEDDAIADKALALGVKVLRGSAEDVLSRYLQLLYAFPDDDVTLLRLCADAPFIQPGWCRAAFYLAETLGKPVWIENFCHVGTASQWRDAEAITRRIWPEDVEHAASHWFKVHGVVVYDFVPAAYGMVNTQEDYEKAQRRFAAEVKA